LPFHDQIENVGGFDPLRKHVALVALGTHEQRRDLGKRRSEPFNVLLVYGKYSDLINHAMFLGKD
jgi:hypothetical protein